MGFNSAFKGLNLGERLKFRTLYKRQAIYLNITGTTRAGRPTLHCWPRPEMCNEAQSKVACR